MGFRTALVLCLVEDLLDIVERAMEEDRDITAEEIEVAFQKRQRAEVRWKQMSSETEDSDGMGT